MSGESSMIFSCNSNDMLNINIKAYHHRDHCTRAAYLAGLGEYGRAKKS